jgi:hypothetical protein
VKVVAGDVETKEVRVDMVISQYIDEAQISNVLAGGLEIVLENVAKGLWMFSWGFPGKLRKSEKR